MRSELKPLVRAIGGRRDDLGPSPAYAGRAGDNSVTAAMIGVGPDAARRATAALLDAGAFDHVVVSGIAGGIAPGIALQTLVTPTVVEDLRSGRTFAPTALGHSPAQGIVATTDELILDELRLGALAGRGVVALDMETAAVAEVCEERGLCWSVFRVVSDRPSDGLLDSGVIELLDADGTVDVARAARYLVRRPGRLGALARLARDASAAARAAAAATVEACRTL